MGKIEDSIRLKMQQNFVLSQLELQNESHMHSVPMGSESHFRLLMVSDDFMGMSRVDRQRRVQDLLVEERSLGLHALTLRLLTGEEAKGPANPSDRGSAFVSPECHSKTKK